jgi:hypothetical protein
MSRIAWAAAITLLVGLTTATAQQRPNLTGVWRMDPSQSRMVGAGGRVGPGPEVRQISWIIAHAEPRINVTVNVRDPDSSRDSSFACSTDGRECVNELPDLNEVRRITATWIGDTLHMSQRAHTPSGNFEATDHLYLTDRGEGLVFDRIIRDARGERVVKQVFRKQQPLSPQPPLPPLRAVILPPALDRVLRDYERFWRTGNADALSELFTADGFVARRGGWIRGRVAIRDAYAGVGSDLRLRPLAYAIADSVGYIVGAYGYGDTASTRDAGRFLLALRQSAGTQWLIAADLDGTNRP